MRTSELKQLCDQHDPWPLFERLIGQELRPGKMIKSPFRDDDKHPSFGVYRGHDGKTRFKDFAGHYGDIYEFIMQWNDVTWKQAVEYVASMLEIRPSITPLPKSVRQQAFRPVQIERPAKCEFFPRSWRAEDYLFWRRWNIDIYVLEHYGVAACSVFNMVNAEDKEMRWRDGGPADPLYVYRIGPHLKLYRPYAPNKSGRYIGNTNRDDIFGIGLLRPDSEEPTVITAGQKDALTMVSNFSARAIAFNSESLVPDQNTMLGIAKRSSRVFCLYDNDPTGFKYSSKLCAGYPFITRIPFEEFAFGRKDVSDMVEAKDRKGMDHIRDLLKS